MWSPEEVTLGGRRQPIRTRLGQTDAVMRRQLEDLPLVLNDAVFRISSVAISILERGEERLIPREKQGRFLQGTLEFT